MKMRFLRPGALAIDASQWGLEFIIEPISAKDAFERIGDLAVITIDGPLTAKPFGPFDSYEAIQNRFASALASDAQTIVLRINSPGGEVSGCFELSEWMRSQAAKANKQVCAFADGQAASAAYALACAATTIYLPPTAGVGSIGCIKVVADQTLLDRASGMNFAVIASGTRKADGNPHTAITDDMRASFQEEIDVMAELFYGLVAGARGVPVGTIEGLQGAQFLGKGAVDAGLADQVLTWDQLLESASTGILNTRTDEGDTMAMKYEDALTGLAKLAEGDDENAKRARRALKAMFDDSDGDEKKDKDGDKDAQAKADEEAKAKAAADEEAKAKAVADDKDKDAKAAAANPGIQALAVVQALSARIAARDEADERSRLLASRPDFAKEVVQALTEKNKAGEFVQPISSVKFAVDTFPKAKMPGQVGAAVAALSATSAVVGEGRSDGAVVAPAYDLDVEMGLKPAKAPITNQGNILALGVMTPTQARAELARRNKEIA